MKKNLVRGIAVFALIALFTCGAAFAAGTVKVTGDVNMRSGPGTQFIVIGSVPSGKTVTYKDYTSSGSGWYYVTYNGNPGWISGSYAKEIGGSTTGNIRMTGKSYLRKLPNLNADTIRTIDKGEELYYFDVSTDSRGVDWYKVTYGGKTGWVSSKYTESISVSSYVYASGSSNIRSQPNLNGSVLGTLPKGASALYLNDSRYDDRGVLWYKVNYNGKVGWVSSKYTEL